MKLTRLCSHAPVAALLPARVGQTGVAINFRSDASKAKAEAVAAQVEASGAKALAVQADVSVEEDVERLFAEVDAKLGRVTALVNNAAILGNKEADLEKLGLDDLTRVLKVNVHGELCRQQLDGGILPSLTYIFSFSFSPCSPVPPPLEGPFLCTRAASKRMSVRNGGKGGCIVNVSSGSALIGSPFCYGISKGGKSRPPFCSRQELGTASRNSSCAMKSTPALNSMQAGLVKDLAAKGIRINTV